jgi:teichuronic acid biosynthesis glycosyltransferase TuaG
MGRRVMSEQSSLQSDAMPSVSVVIPAYNAAATIASTVRSILAQTEPALEVIVVDDRSKDATESVVASLAAADPRVRYLQMPTNSGGPAGPRNEGIAHARAHWIALCDADDIWHPQKLQRQMDCAKRYRVDFVCTQIADFDDGASIQFAPVAPDVPSKVSDITLWEMLKKDRVATSSVLVRRGLLGECGGFDTDRAMIAVEDYDLWLRCLERRGQQCIRLEEALVHYRKSPGSLSANKWKHARKVWRVLVRYVRRSGKAWQWPLLPWLFGHYILSSIYLRLCKGSL